MLLFGLPMFGLYTLRGAERQSGSVLRFRPVLATIALVGIGLSILGVMVLAASMGGGAIGEVDGQPGNLGHDDRHRLAAAYRRSPVSVVFLDRGMAAADLRIGFALDHGRRGTFYAGVDRPWSRR